MDGSLNLDDAALGILGGGFGALGYHVDTFNSGSVLAYLYREHTALLAAVIACEDVNDIALFDILFAHCGLLQLAD